MQNRYRLFERLQDPVLLLEFTEGLCLFTKNGGDGLDGVTVPESLGEWMLVQRYARLDLVVLEGSLKEHL